MYSLTYVSQSLLRPFDVDDEIRAIVDTSLARNAAAGVTGALLYTGHRFAQFLEGPHDAVLDIMDSIMRDGRHADVTLLAKGSAEIRRFAQWSLVYLGRSTFADAIVQRARAEKDQVDGVALRNLMHLLQELARSTESTRPAG